MYFLWARHDHNKVAPCGMIKVFELNGYLGMKYQQPSKQNLNSLQTIQIVWHW